MDLPVARECVLLGRYDREAASVLLEPIAAYLRSRALRQGSDISPTIVLALAAVDPALAVALVESIPVAKSLNVNEPSNLVRQSLSEHLSMPDERRLMRMSRDNAGCGLAMFDEAYRDL